LAAVSRSRSWGFALGLEDGHELGRQGDGLAASFLDFPEDQAAALAVRTGGGVAGASGRAEARIVSGDADVRAAGLAEGLEAAPRARSPVPGLGAGRHVGAAMPPGQAL
jgi:hypothetical protein